MESQPDLYSLEKNGKDHKERRFDLIEDRVEDQNEDLRIAREALLGNDELYKRFFRAMKDVESMDASGFAHIENRFIKECQNLSLEDIESLVRQFNRGLNGFASKNPSALHGATTSPENIRRREIKTQGIVSVIDFIKARKSLFDLDPQTRYRLYTEDTLDAKFKIDLIECIFDEDADGNLSISTMSLIQVKSSERNEDEQEAILNSHRSWVNTSLMDFQSLREEYTAGLPDGIPIETLSQNADETALLLLDITTDPDGFNVDNFVSRLGIDDLTKKQKAWLLSESGERIKKIIANIQEEGQTPIEESGQIVKTLDDMQTTSRTKAKLPKNIARVGAIKSITAIGPKIVHENVIAAPTENPDHAKIMKYS